MRSISKQPQSRFSEHERRHAVERAAALMAAEKYSQNRACAAVGEDLGVTGRTVALWAADLEIPLATSREATKKASAAIAVYGAERRRELSDLLFSRVNVVAQNSNDPGALKDLATTFGILTDKRRLEEGKATERTESLDQRAAVERAKQSLHSIAGGRSA